MKIPPYLNKGDKISIISTARKLTEAEVMPAVNKFKEWGLEVILGDNIFNELNQFAGTDEERAADLQRMLDDDSIRAVICARGGYGTVRIIDSIDFSRFAVNPKWVIGYSDVTVLHSHIHSNYQIETLHAVMPFNFPNDGIDNPATESLRKALFGENLSYETATSQICNYGKTSAIITGGNLSILYSLSNTASDIDTDGKILFIEDLDEYLYHIDRMMMNLKRSGKLSRLNGLIVGGMTEMKDNTVPYGKTAEEIIFDAVKEYDYPVCFNFPAGHIKDNLAIIFGRKATFEINNKTTKLIL
jgi:muramoyltetrapeptide carboxypeptidase